MNINKLAFYSTILVMFASCSDHQKSNTVESSDTTSVMNTSTGDTSSAAGEMNTNTTNTPGNTGGNAGNTVNSSETSNTPGSAGPSYPNDRQNINRRDDIGPRGLPNNRNTGDAEGGTYAGDTAPHMDGKNSVR